MLQFDIRVTVRNKDTREVLQAAPDDVDQALYQLESLIDENTITLADGRDALLTIAHIKEVK